MKLHIPIRLPFKKDTLKCGSCLALLLFPAVIFSNPVLIGEHKLCDGIELKPRQTDKFNVIYHSDRNLIEINGALDIGVTNALKEALKKHPETSGILLNSKGGNIYQGRGIARLVESHKLNTHVDDLCYSACSIAFMAGNHRYISHDGQIGFHGYRMDSLLASPNIDIAKEEELDFTFFSQHIDDPEFLSKIFSTHCDSIWVPTLEELIEAKIIH